MTLLETVPHICMVVVERSMSMCPFTSNYLLFTFFIYLNLFSLIVAAATPEVLLLFDVNLNVWCKLICLWCIYMVKLKLGAERFQI